MVQKNTCLRRLSIGFSAILGLLGAILVSLGALVHAHEKEVEQSEKDTFAGATLCCVFGSLTLGACLIGIYGAYKEKKIPLRIYFGILIGEILYILYFIVQLVSLKSKINEQLDAEFKSMKTLNSAPDEIQENFRKIQTGFECCGYFGYQDWADEIPESCKCPSLDLAKSKCQTVKTKKKTYSYGFQEKYVEVQVYKEPCGPAISQYMASGVNAVFGFASTFLVVMIVSALLSIGLYLSIEQQDNTTAVSSEDPRLSLKFCNNDIITA